MTIAMYLSIPKTAIPTQGHVCDSGSVSSVREQIAELWLAGVSAVRIAVQLDMTELTVRTEARHLGLPSRLHSKDLRRRAGGLT